MDIKYWDGHIVFPLSFPYLEAVLSGRPRHTMNGMDSFAAYHPLMDRRNRAKLFAPFDALDGYSDSVRAKNVSYIQKPELNEYAQEELNQRLRLLHSLTKNGTLARRNQVGVSIRYFVPCQDKNNFAYGSLGQVVCLSGICRKVDAEIQNSVTVDQTVIPLADILGIEMCYHKGIRSGRDD